MFISDGNKKSQKILRAAFPFVRLLCKGKNDSLEGMFDEEFKPRKKPGFEKRKLVDMSVGELEEYIVELKEEIVRAEEDIKKKKSSQAAAASFFKSQEN